MTRLLIIGAGGHGCVIADAAMTTGLWDTISFVDDDPRTQSVLGCELIGSTNDLEVLAKEYSDAAIGVGNARVRLDLLRRCRLLGFNLPNVVHRSACVSPFATIGAGTVVFAHAAVNPRAIIGDACIVNTGATVDHDCHLEDGAHVSPGAHLAGNVHIGKHSWIGIGASIRQGLRIGSDVIVGAGAAVICDIESGVTVVGVPARVRRGR